MIILLRGVNGEKTFYLRGKKEFIVGRKDCDILIENDQSISRRHAIVYIKDNNNVYVTDLGSKYKTVFKEEELKPNVETLLEPNDEIKFGVFKSIYRLERYNYVTCSTRLGSTSRANLVKELEALGVQYVDNWTPECTHLTIPEMSLTVKVLHALLDGKLIVTPFYWTKFVENASKNLQPPNAEDYSKAPAAEPLLKKANLSVNPLRKTLFKDKVFLFLKEHDRKHMEDVIRKAGGISKSWETNSIPIEEVINSAEKFIVVQIPNQDGDSSFNKLTKRFCNMGKRVVPLQDIAMAILMCSCSTYCNPDFKLAEQVFRNTSPRMPTQIPLARETQSEYFSVKNYEADNTKMIIPDTYENQCSTVFNNENSPEKSIGNSISEKPDLAVGTTKRGGEELTDNAFKRMKLEKSGRTAEKSREVKTKDAYLSKSSPQKRKAEECIEIDDSPIKKNPFSSIKKKVKNEPTTSKSSNPFESLKRTKSNTSELSPDNALGLILTNKKVEGRRNDTSMRNILSSTRKNGESKPETTVSVSRINSWDLDDSAWLSKNSTDTEVRVKEELDSEMQNYIDMFKDKIVIDVMKIVSRPVTDGDKIDGRNSTSVKNFKKFRKVMPLRPQRTIIGQETLVAVGTGPTTSIRTLQRVHLQDSDDESNKRKRANRYTPKKFII